MKFQLEIGDDIQKMVKKLESVKGGAADEAYQIVKTVTDKLQEETIKRAPIDEGFLEKSIEKEVISAKTATEVEGHVFIPSNSPASDYALYMHEGDYNLGPISKEKQLAMGEVKIGPKYMHRALEENERAFLLYIKKKLHEFIGD